MAKTKPVFSFEKFNALVANYAQAHYSLSASSKALFLCLIAALGIDEFYHDDNSAFLPSEKDDIDEIIANALKELTEGFTLNTLTINAPVLLYEETLSSPDAFIVYLDAIPEYADCTAIEIFAHVRAYATGGAALVKLFFNLDGTESNYDNSRVVQFTSLSGQNNTGIPAIGATPSDSQQANLYTDLHILVQQPHSAHLKHATNLQPSTQNLSNSQVEIDGLTWNSTAAITNFQLSANYLEIAFKAGSWIKVIGHKEKVVYVP